MIHNQLEERLFISIDKNMHKKAIDRIKKAKDKSEIRPELASKLPKKDYKNFKDGVSRLCDDIIKENIKPEEKRKIAWLKSRIEIEI